MNSEEASRPKGQKIQKPARKGELELNYCWWARLDPDTPPCRLAVAEFQVARSEAPPQCLPQSHVSAFQGLPNRIHFRKFCNVGSGPRAALSVFLRWLPPSNGLYFPFSFFYTTKYEYTTFFCIFWGHRTTERAGRSSNAPCDRSLAR